MKNADMPAMPLRKSLDTWEADEYETGGGRYLRANGLTKREMFAMNALQGLLSNSNIKELSECELSEIATNFADALLAELEE